MVNSGDKNRQKPEESRDDAMKEVAQKSIQSLHAFRRHFKGGSISALPRIFKIHDLFFLPAVITMFLYVNICAEQKDTSLPQGGGEEKRLDLLFEGIMESLPHEIRKEIDSAAGVRTERRRPVEMPENRKSPEVTPSQVRGFNELPDELKIQVEHAISDMEKRKEERRSQFREMQRRGR